MKQINPSGTPVKTVLALIRRFPSVHVFPIRAGAKSPPLIADNLSRASNNAAQAESWAKQFPGCNFGIALAQSHLIVPDVDTRGGKRGKTTLGELELQHGLLPRTLTVTTPSGGWHLYFRETAFVRHSMRVSAFGPDVDSTNYVLAPGGVLASGGAYKIVADAPIADAPPWFAEYLGAAPLIGDNSQVPMVEQDTPDLIAWAIHYLKHDAKPAVQFRNGEFTLLMTAATLKDRGISETKAVELLAEHYNPRCQPPWSIGDGATADRLDVKVHNAWAYLKQTMPGAHTAQAEFGDDPVDGAALDRLAEWWKQRAAAEAEGEQPTNRERALMQRKRRKP